MPPKKNKVVRDPAVTRITRADARANPAVQAAVNATALASRGLAELPTAEETAAIVASVVEARNNRPPPEPKTKNPQGAKPTGVTKNKESKKEKAAAAAVAAAAAAAKEAEEIKNAIEAVETAKALEAVKNAEAEAAAETEKEGGTGEPIIVEPSSSEETVGTNSDDGKKGGETESNSRKSVDPPTEPPGGKITGGSGGNKSGNGIGGHPPGPPIGGETESDDDKIRGSELLKRLEGVDWAELGEKLSAELYSFVRAGGTVEEWEQKREEQLALDTLTEAIGYASSSEEEMGEVDDNDVYSEEEEEEDWPETVEVGGYNPVVIRCLGSTSGSEDGEEPETESDSETEESEDHDYGKTFCPWSGPGSGDEAETESELESEGEEGFKSGGSRLDPYKYGRRLKTPDTPEKKTSHTRSGGPNPKTPGSDAKKSAGKKESVKKVSVKNDSEKKTPGEKRKAEDSPEQKPPKKTKLDEDSGGQMIFCWWPEGYSSNRWDLSVWTSVSRGPSTGVEGHVPSNGISLQPLPKKGTHDQTKTIICRLPVSSKPSHKDVRAKNTVLSEIPLKAKKGSGTKRKSAESAEQRSSKKGKYGEGVICELPTIPSKKSRLDEEAKLAKEETGKEGWFW